jgi:Zn-dependent M28 family amino/carboxypeptidase
LNDLYLQTGLLVKEKLNPNFMVDSNPYEGGSDHSPFVQNALSRVGSFIPALLTWHFTDYVYHSSCDTLDKLSVSEFHNVGTVSAAVIYQMANGWEVRKPQTRFIQVLKSWETRMEV